MQNEIVLKRIIKKNNTVRYIYVANGEWKEIFKKELSIEYDQNIEIVPDSVLVVPFLCNILPISWIYDATIKVKECDADFFKSIDEFKNGYINMYKRIKFLGKLDSEKLVNNKKNSQKGAITFFSGGVDAFNTLLNHIDEKPSLVTVLGADVELNNEEAWKNILNHIKLVAEEYRLNYNTIKSNFRDFIDYNIINEYISKFTNEDWWHGFQHGIGVISLAAPIAFLEKKNIIYFASTFRYVDKNVTCASHYTIDNYLKFCGVDVIHDGAEFDRQEKVHNIVEFCKKNKKRVHLRVCWKEKNGNNCCQCEKCWRTIFELIAEKANPIDYGFEISKNQLKNSKRVYYEEVPKFRRDNYYKPTQSLMKENISIKDLPKELRWFYKIDIDKLGYHPYYKYYQRIKRKIGRILKGG